MSDEDIETPIPPQQDVIVIDDSANEWRVKENRFTPLVESIRGLVIQTQEEELPSSEDKEMAEWLEDALYSNEIGSSDYTSGFSDAGGLDALLLLALSPFHSTVRTVAWRSIGEAIHVDLFSSKSTCGG